MSVRSVDDPAPMHNLPVSASSFVGRTSELGKITDLLSRSRLVTLTGPGGVGKTRLAIQAAFGLLEGSGDGVWLNATDLTSFRVLSCGVVPAVLGCGELCPDLYCLCVSRRK